MTNSGPTLCCRDRAIRDATILHFRRRAWTRAHHNFSHDLAKIEALTTQHGKNIDDLNDRFLAFEVELSKLQIECLHLQITIEQLKIEK
jgi:hypothetical protein